MIVYVTLCYFYNLFFPSMTEQNVNMSDLKEVAIQEQLLNNCLKKLPGLQGKVKEAQLVLIQLKYQYFLRKFQKCTEEHKKYKELYQNIEKTVQQSTQIRDENRSIEFIKKIMQDTQKKYNKLKENIQNLKNQKETIHNELIQLRNILLKMKGEFFQFKRTEEYLINKAKQEEADAKSKENSKTMFKIRQEKKLQQTKNKKIRQTSHAKPFGELSIMNKKVWEEFQLINHLKNDFLHRIGITQQQFYKLNEKQLNQKSKLNKLIGKKEFWGLKNNHYRQSQTTEPQPREVFRIGSEFDQQFKDFMSMSNEEIIKLIIKQNKVAQVLQLIEQQKRSIITSYQSMKPNRARIS